MDGTTYPLGTKSLVQVRAESDFARMCRDAYLRLGPQTPFRTVPATQGGQVALFSGLGASMAYVAQLAADGIPSRVCMAAGYAATAEFTDRHPHGVLIDA